ncbi:hypothetical protein BJAS_P2428 [Bathymodiolus japonicus methanotrophic gill symbiont]|uniref:DUF3465 domain-containing protein n=1 Tax=Bathymodiolus japonicus methanotrophic gill symbiont TaxID=113269 RepID=UPI001B510253|nr:DUF3465 domain-containing protein [Bathymodiolus japonicus methanotrophic gill symbiont]GFO72303.1 hypothetical protein BJAS_P2428 [Bathymodiolus japonicus methanotrophic gill symbiont]
MKKTLILLVTVALIIFESYQEQGNFLIADDLLQTFTLENSENNSLQRAFNNKQSDLQIQGAGVVVKVLRDDTKGSKHQKFILRNNTGQSVLVAHNIDLAPRLSGLKKGDTVEFYGEYEWNAKGGVIHWTHKAPGSRHISGWLKYQGRTYQ